METGFESEANQGSTSTFESKKTTLSPATHTPGHR